MLYRSFLSPFNFSKRLEGGILKSFNPFEFLIILNFLKANICRSFDHFFENVLLKTFSVSLHLKDFIMSYIIYNTIVLSSDSISVLSFCKASPTGKTEREAGFYCICCLRFAAIGFHIRNIRKTHFTQGQNALLVA